MAGYHNYSMSNNAVQAYSDGEKPLTKWTKSELLDCLSSEQQEFCRRLTLQELRQELLEYAGWHHTSNYYNKTRFYAISEEAVQELTEDKVATIIECRATREKKSTCEPVVEMYITALVRYDEWEGSRKHPKLVHKEDIVFYKSNEKMVTCYNSNNYQKRLSSLQIVFKIEQKTKFATEEQLRKKYASFLKQKKY